MIRIISVWIKNPITGWHEVPLQETLYNNAEVFLRDLIGRFDLNAGSIHGIETEIKGSCEKHSFKIKDNIQVKHAEVNQAEYEVKLIMNLEKKPSVRQVLGVA